MAGKVQYPIISRNEAAVKAGVSPQAISAAVSRGELTKVTRLNFNEYRINGVYIFDDGFFSNYCEKVAIENYKNSGRKRLEKS